MAAFLCEKGWVGEGWCEWVQFPVELYNRQCALHYTEKSVGDVYSVCLLLWQWNGSSCFVLQQKAEIIRIWINKIHATILIILLFCFVFSLVLLKSMGGTIPPAPANASAEETSKVRYEEFIAENWCWQNYWAAEGGKLLSVFTHIEGGECESSVWSLPIVCCRWLVTDGFLVHFKCYHAPFP